MARVVGVHGAFHELWGPHQIAGRWIPALRDGLALAGADVAAEQVAMAFYGDLLPRPIRRRRSTTPRCVRWPQRTGILDAATQLVGTDGLAGLVEQIGREQVRRTIAQLGRYFDDDAIRDAVRARVASAIGSDTVVVVAHSLGTIVAYEVLAAMARSGPAGPRDDRLAARPPRRRRRRPPAAARTTASAGGRRACGGGRTSPPAHDPVADGRPLAAVFAGVVEERVDNGHRAHDPEPYLCAPSTGAAIAAAMG